jgi:hypothetical protein
MSDLTINVDERLDRTDIYQDDLDVYVVDMEFKATSLRLVLDASSLERLTLHLRKWSDKREAERVKREGAAA